MVIEDQDSGLDFSIDAEQTAARKKEHRERILACNSILENYRAWTQETGRVAVDSMTDNRIGKADDVAGCILELEILQAQNLPPLDRGLKPDTFCCISAIGTDVWEQTKEEDTSRQLDHTANLGRAFRSDASDETRNGHNFYTAKLTHRVQQSLERLPSSVTFSSTHGLPVLDLFPQFRTQTQNSKLNPIWKESFTILKTHEGIGYANGSWIPPTSNEELVMTGKTFTLVLVSVHRVSAKTGDVSVGHVLLKIAPSSLGQGWCDATYPLVNDKFHEVHNGISAQSQLRVRYRFHNPRAIDVLG